MRRAEALGLHLEPDGVELVGRQLALAARLVHLALERIERDLAHHRVEHVLDLAGDQRLALLGIARSP